MSATNVLRRPRQLSIRSYFGAAAALALATFLPWVSVRMSVGAGGGSSLFGATITTKPGSGGVVYLLLFAAAYAGAGHVLRQNRAPRWLPVAMWAVNGWMVFNLFAISSGLHGQDTLGQYVSYTTTPAIGMVLAGAAVAAGIVASVGLLRARKAPVADEQAGFAAATTS
jgi:hypothetical protein